MDQIHTQEPQKSGTYKSYFLLGKAWTHKDITMIPQAMKTVKMVVQNNHKNKQSSQKAMIRNLPNYSKEMQHS